MLNQHREKRANSLKPRKGFKTHTFKLLSHVALSGKLDHTFSLLLACTPVGASAHSTLRVRLCFRLYKPGFIDWFQPHISIASTHIDVQYSSIHSPPLSPQKWSSMFLNLNYKLAQESWPAPQFELQSVWKKIDACTTSSVNLDKPILVTLICFTLI